jgi:hypothetical protein
MERIEEILSFEVLNVPFDSVLRAESFSFSLAVLHGGLAWG